MKTLIQFSVVILTVCAMQVKAQTRITVPSAVQESFGKEFGLTTDVQWTEDKEILQSRFQKDHEKFIAYFNRDGALLLTARRIDLPYAPTLVRKSVASLQAKYHSASAVEMYELSESTDTRYFVNIKGKSQFISAVADINGSCKVLKKVNLPLTENQSDILAQMR